MPVRKKSTVVNPLIEMKRFNMKKYISFGLFVGVAIVVASCSKDPQSPGYEYMPDMYRSVGPESYSANVNFKDGANAQAPVDGSIPYQTDRSKIYNVLPYAYANTPEGYAASVALTNPIPFSEAVLGEGKVLFTNMCSHCHGEKGMGDGKIGQKQPGLIPPAYNSDQLKNLPAGQIFHSITWGKGMMGPHQYQISKLDRWKLVHYVQSLQKIESAPAADAKPAAATDSTAKK
jgi:mono/diheme cytochrome c family protein